MHGTAADAQESRRIGNGQGLSGRKRRIFPKRVTGNEGRIATEIDTGLRFKRPKRGERDCHQRRLRILGEGERLGRPIPHRVAELLPKRRVDFLKDPARRRKGFGQSLAHADRLTALAGKHESERHSLPLKGGAKDTAFTTVSRERRPVTKRQRNIGNLDEPTAAWLRRRPRVRFDEPIFSSHRGPT